MSFWSNLIKTPKERELSVLEDAKKEAILNKFSVTDMEAICHEYGINKPPHQRGEVIPLKKYVRYLKDRINIAQLQKISTRRKIDVSSIIEDYRLESNEINQKYSINGHTEEIESSDIDDDTEFEEILKDIDENFRPEEVRDEEELEKILVEFLKIRYPNKRIERQIDSPKGRIDVVIDGKYGLEIKIAESREKLRNLIGQVEDYLKIYKEVVAVVLDPHKVDLKEIEEYGNHITDLGAYFLTVRGELKRKKKTIKVVVTQ